MLAGGAVGELPGKSREALRLARKLCQGELRPRPQRRYVNVRSHLKEYVTRRHELTARKLLQMRCVVATTFLRARRNGRDFLLQ